MKLQKNCKNILKIYCTNQIIFELPKPSILWSPLKMPKVQNRQKISLQHVTPTIVREKKSWAVLEVWINCIFVDLDFCWFPKCRETHTRYRKFMHAILTFWFMSVFGFLIWNLNLLFNGFFWVLLRKWKIYGKPNGFYCKHLYFLKNSAKMMWLIFFLKL